MGLKGVHKFGRDNGAYQQKASIPAYLNRQQVDIIYVDYYCVFYFLLLRGGLAMSLFELSLAHQFGKKHRQFRALVCGFVDATMEYLNRLSADSGGADICIVTDGERLPAKMETHQTRRKNQNLAFCEARTLYNRYGYDHDDLRVQVQRWVSFSLPFKRAIMTRLKRRKSIRPYRERVQQTEPRGTHMFYHQAPFEADSEIVYLCDTLTPGDRGAILSDDGDLFAYGGAVNAIRIVNIYWDNANLPGTVTTKAKLLKKLKFPINDRVELAQSEARFAVLAATCGNDYAENVKNFSFRKIAKMIQVQRFTAWPVNADKLLQTVCYLLEYVTDDQAFRFKVALHQFCKPVVSRVAESGDQGAYEKRHRSVIQVEYDPRVQCELGVQGNVRN
ncbi:hypothetical protein BJV82DRAFT_597360 [Fennellomyces sp. T-0311]|nr:hypothetical protein BJV82DRAFT_597360 [Fennellomyces sp. T-0311]